MEDARERLAKVVQCRAGEVVFTSGATESNNLMVFHLAQAQPGEVLVSSLEHPSVLAPVRRWLSGRHERIPATRTGVIDLDWLAGRLKARKPGAVLLMAANNETGVIQPWREAHALCEEHGVQFGCDAAQWVGKMPAGALGVCGLTTGCAHKFGGPVGVGFIKGPLDLTALLVGGPQEDRRRAGTENLPGIMAMVAALEWREQLLAAGGMEERLGWRDCFSERLLAAVPGTELLGTSSPRLWNTVSVLLPDRADKRRWVVALDRMGFAVSSGSACSSGQEKASHVLEAMGLDAGEAGRAVRFSSGWETPREAWDALLEGVVASTAGG